MQILNISVDHVYLACGYTDMRKSIDSLASVVQQNFKLDPFANDIFIFCGRRHDRIKALLWRGDGVLLMYKRLDNGKFHWQQKEEDVITITEQQLRWLMKGLDISQPKAVKRSFPRQIIWECESLSVKIII